MARALVVEILSDAKKFGRGFDEAERRMGEFGRKTDQAGRSTSKFQKRVDAAARSISAIAKVAATAAIAKFAVDAIKAASDLNESMNAVQSVFGTASERITNFGQIAAQSVGLAQSEFQQLSATTGALLTNFGFSADEAAKQTIRLTRRAADLASVFNTTVPDALNAVNAALRGENEPIRRYGVTLSDAAVRAKAVELGLADTAAAVDANGKAVGALELFYEQTSKAQGDFIETSDELANSQRILAAEFEDAKASFGQAAIPVATSALGFFENALLDLRSLFGDEQATRIRRFGEAFDYALNKVKGGAQGPKAVAESIAALANEIGITATEFEQFATLAGVDTADGLKDVKDAAIDMAEELGYSQEVIDAIEQAFLDLFRTNPPDHLENIVDPGRRVAEVLERIAVARPFDGVIRAQLGALQGALAAAAESGQSVVSALIQIFDPVARSVGAAQRLQSAQQNLKSVEGDRKATAEDIALAQLEVLQATLEAEAAQEQLADTDLTAVTEAAERILDGAIEDGEAFLRILGILDQFEFAPKDFLPGFPTSIDPELWRALTGTSLAGETTLREHGGPVFAGRPYIVGEAGPELFVPSSSGQIVPNGAGAVVTFNNVFYTSQPIREIERDLRRLESEVVN